MQNWLYRIASIALSVWLMYFMIICESATGLIVLILSLIISTFYLVYASKRRLLKLFSLPLISLLIIGVLFFSIKEYQTYFNAEKFDPSTLDSVTKNGNPYLETDDYGTLENGNYLWKYFCQKEMVHAWMYIRNTQEGGLATAEDGVFGVLARYLTSKGLRKDSVGVYSLTEQDIENVRNGITNYKIPERNGIQRRLNELFYEVDRFRNHADPSGSSLISRLYYWQAGRSLAKQHPVLGIGTGSLRIALAQEYEKIGSPLDEDSRHLIHNQFLTFFVQFGAVGLLWILFVLFYPVLSLKNNLQYISLLFFSVFIMSCVTEDTLNTQAGLTFFIFFYSLFFLRKSLPKKDVSDLE